MSDTGSAATPRDITLVLLPGLDGTGIFFRPLLQSLPAWIRPVVVTYPEAGPHAYEELLAHVEAHVAGLSRFAVLGWSFGGPLALRLANRHPDRVHALVLCNTFVTAPNPRLKRIRPFVTGPVYAIVRTLRRTRLLVPGGASAGFRRAKAETWRRVGSRALAARSRAILALDAREELRACRVRLMYLAASRDEVVGRASRDEIVSLAPRVEVAEVDGKHFALFHTPERNAACIVDFLRRESAS